LSIASPDVQRAERLPPNQTLTRKWPILHAGAVPPSDPANWTFSVVGLVESPWRSTYQEFLELPRCQVRADMHCVTGWSKLDNVWEGVATRTLLALAHPKPAARFVLVHAEYGFTTNLPLDDFLGIDCLFAWKHNGELLAPDHGFPLRLVVPRLYAWKSAKWVRGIEFMAEDRAGFWESWENGGYHMRGDPWTEDRFRSDRELPTS
jgi:DMSO/TMAO reductase YedYZ molybdopterin-dependent catalytic subunit